MDNIPLEGALCNYFKVILLLTFLYVMQSKLMKINLPSAGWFLIPNPEGKNSKIYLN